MGGQLMHGTDDDLGQPIIVAGVGALAFGVLASMLLAGLEEGGPNWADGIQLSCYALAAAVVTGVLGLIFAVPRIRDGAELGTEQRFLANSNLEQISDWLTKILVGAGLVQLANLPGALSRLGDYLGGGIEVPNAEAASVSLTMFGGATGFLASYLWARLRLRVLFETTERQAEETARTIELVQSDLAQANRSADEPVDEGVLATAASSAVERASRRPDRATGTLLWVDDVPSNNTSLVQALERVGVRVDLALTTEQALALLRQRSYGVVITDLGRRENGEDVHDAGLVLLRSVRSLPTPPPVIVYASRRAVEQRDEILKAGARLSTNQPTEVFETAVRILAGE